MRLSSSHSWGIPRREHCVPEMSERLQIYLLLTVGYAWLPLRCLFWDLEGWCKQGVEKSLVFAAQHTWTALYLKQTEVYETRAPCHWIHDIVCSCVTAHELTCARNYCEDVGFNQWRLTVERYKSPQKRQIKHKFERVSLEIPNKLKILIAVVSAISQQHTFMHLNNTH